MLEREFRLYFLGLFRIATAPEPNSSLLTSFSRHASKALRTTSFLDDLEREVGEDPADTLRHD